jgi:hypothetical protein
MTSSDSLSLLLLGHSPRAPSVGKSVTLTASALVFGWDNIYVEPGTLDAVGCNSIEITDGVRLMLRP